MPQVRAGQRVTIEGRAEVFVVLRVDRERHLADLLRQTNVRRVEVGVPVALLRPAEETAIADDDAKVSA